VVATAVGGVPKIVKSTGSGWLCEPDHPEALAGAMELAIANRDRGELTSRARKLASELYSAKRMAVDYEAVYEKLIVGS
jgi:glycosyltransferase involved in cell wall biosynthesis